MFKSLKRKIMGGENYYKLGESLIEKTDEYYYSKLEECFDSLDIFMVTLPPLSDTTSRSMMPTKQELKLYKKKMTKQEYISKLQQNIQMMGRRYGTETMDFYNFAIFNILHINEADFETVKMLGEILISALNLFDNRSLIISLNDFIKTKNLTKTSQDFIIEQLLDFRHRWVSIYVGYILCSNKKKLTPENRKIYKDINSVEKIDKIISVCLKKDWERYSQLNL